MNKKKIKLRLTITLTILLALVALFLIFNNRHSTINKEETAFNIEDTASITKIFMSNKKDSTLLMERTNTHKWKLNKKYYVRQDIIETLLKTFYKIRVKQPVNNAAIDNAIEQLATASTKVEIYQNAYRINLFNKIKLFPHEKLSKVFYVGFDTQDNMGTVMLLEGAERPYVTYIPGFRGLLSSRFVVRTADYRDLTLYAKKINDIHLIEVELPGKPLESYKLRNNNDKTISLLETNGNNIPYIDTLKVLRYMNYFQKVVLDEFFIDGREVIDSLLQNAQPTHIVTLHDMKGNKETAKFFRKRNIPTPYFEDQYDVMTDKEKSEYKKQLEEPEWDPNSLYVIFNDNSDVGLGPLWMLEKILRTRSYFTGIEPENEQ